MPSLAQFSMQDLGHTFEFNKDKSSRLRDEKLAKENPNAWCADRCLSTGHCDVLEDIYEMTTAQVRATRSPVTRRGAASSTSHDLFTSLWQVQKFCEACAGSDECELAYA